MPLSWQLVILEKESFWENLSHLHICLSWHLQTCHQTKQMLDCKCMFVSWVQPPFIWRSAFMLSRHNVKTFLFQLRCCTSALQCSVDAGLPASVCGMCSCVRMRCTADVAVMLVLRGSAQVWENDLWAPYHQQYSSAATNLFINHKRSHLNQTETRQIVTELAVRHSYVAASPLLRSWWFRLKMACL